MKTADPNSKPHKRLRRQRGNGSIFTKPPSKFWVIQFYANGKRIREYTGSTDKEAAKKKLREKLGQVDNNEYVPRSGKVRVKDLYDLLKQHNQTKHIGREREVPNRWAHLEPVFGRMLAADVTTDVVRHYTIQRQKAHAADATINRELATLKLMFKLAMQDTPPKMKLMPHIPMLKENNARSNFVESTHFDQLAAEAKELWLRLFLELAFTYGWRADSELLSLRVRQGNLDNKTIRLDPGTTKNREGREVVMTARVAQLWKEAVSKKGRDDFVLTRRDGKPVKDMRAAWRNLCIQAGLGRWICLPCWLATRRDTTPLEIPVPAGTKKCPKCGAKVVDETRKYVGLIRHDMRRSAAKALRHADVPESVVMKMGGWKTAAMFRRYAIVNNTEQQAAVAKLEQARVARPVLAAAPDKPLLDQKSAAGQPAVGSTKVQ
jgi:integrase